MKYHLILMLFLFLGASSQHLQPGMAMVVKHIKINGQSFRISAYPIKGLRDTARLIIKSDNGSLSKSQQLKVPYSYPLTITLKNVNKLRGFTVTFDPLDKWGSSVLYLFDSKHQQFKLVPNFEKLGAIENLLIHNQMYYYSYKSCGCADGCWTSNLFRIRSFKIENLGSLHCDCEKLIENADGLKKVINQTCKEFAYPKKFEKIKAHWVRRLK